MSRYVDEGLTFDRIAAEEGMSRQTLMAWAKKGQWKELRETQKDFDEKLLLARNRLLDEFLQSTDTDQNKIYAVQKIEALRRTRAGDEKPAVRIQEALGIFVNVMREHPVFGPLIEKHGEELYTMFTERMEAAVEA